MCGCVSGWCICLRAEIRLSSWSGFSYTTTEPSVPDLLPNWYKKQLHVPLRHSHSEINEIAFRHISVILALSIGSELWPRCPVMPVQVPTNRGGAFHWAKAGICPGPRPPGGPRRTSDFIFKKLRIKMNHLSLQTNDNS